MASPRFVKGDRAGNAQRRSRVAYGKMSKTRKLLRRLPAELTAPIKKVLEEGAAAILADAKAAAPRSSGAGPHAADALSMRISRDGLRAEVGLIGKRAKKRGFYLKFHETGTAGVKDGFGAGIELPPIPPRPFLGPAFDAHAQGIRDKVEAAITRALNRAAGIENSVNTGTFVGHVGIGGGDVEVTD